MLRKDFHYYYTKSFRNFSEIFCAWFAQRNKHFTKFSGKFGATFIEIFHESVLLRYLKYYTKSCRNFSTKFLEIFRTRSKNFLTNISTTLKKYFSKNYTKCCVKIPTIITRKVSDTFTKYFVYGLDREHKYLTKCSGKFGARFIEIFGKSFLLRYLKPQTQNLAETFLQSFSKSIPTLIPENVSETFLQYFM